MPAPALQGGRTGALAAAYGDDDDAPVSVMRLRTDDLVALALGDTEDDVDSAATTASGALASAFALAQATEPSLILLDDAHRLLPPQPGTRGGSGTAEAATAGVAPVLRRLRGAVRTMRNPWRRLSLSPLRTSPLSSRSTASFAPRRTALARVRSCRVQRSNRSRRRRASRGPAPALALTERTR